MKKTLTPLNRYKLKLKLKYLGKVAWSMLVNSSKILIGLFFLITAFTFWQIITLVLINQGIDISKEVSQMMLIVLMMVVIIAIDKLKNLSINNGK